MSHTFLLKQYGWNKMQMQDLHPILQIYSAKINYAYICAAQVKYSSYNIKAFHFSVQQRTFFLSLWLTNRRRMFMNNNKKLFKPKTFLPNGSEAEAKQPLKLHLINGKILILRY